MLKLLKVTTIPNSVTFVIKIKCDIMKIRKRLH